MKHRLKRILLYHYQKRASDKLNKRIEHKLIGTVQKERYAKPRKLLLRQKAIPLQITRHHRNIPVTVVLIAHKLSDFQTHLPKLFPRIRRLKDSDTILFPRKFLMRIPKQLPLQVRKSRVIFMAEHLFTGNCFIRLAHHTRFLAKRIKIMNSLFAQMKQLLLTVQQVRIFARIHRNSHNHLPRLNHQLLNYLVLHRRKARKAVKHNHASKNNT